MNGLKLFFHNSKYTMLSMFRLKVTLFWTLAFPLLLATFMYMAFGNLFEKDEMFKTINVAVVESENDDTLMSVLESLDVNHTDSASKSDDKDDSSNSFSDLINMKLMDSSAAKKALNDKKVTGIIYTEDASLVVDENSYNATILESILTQYKQQKDVFTNIAKPIRLHLRLQLPDYLTPHQSIKRFLFHREIRMNTPITFTLYLR